MPIEPDNVTTLLVAANAAATILEAVLPQLQQAAKSGQISVEVQQQLMDRIENARELAGPQWHQVAPAPELEG